MHAIVSVNQSMNIRHMDKPSLCIWLYVCKGGCCRVSVQIIYSLNWKCNHCIAPWGSVITLHPTATHPGGGILWISFMPTGKQAQNGIKLSWSCANVSPLCSCASLPAPRGASAIKAEQIKCNCVTHGGEIGSFQAYQSQQMRVTIIERPQRGTFLSKCFLGAAASLYMNVNGANSSKVHLQRTVQLVGQIFQMQDSKRRMAYITQPAHLQVGLQTAFGQSWAMCINTEHQKTAALPDTTICPSIIYSHLSSHFVDPFYISATCKQIRGF